MPYMPSPTTIDRYASLLVNFALADGRGVQPGQTVRVSGAEETKPLFAAICRAVWQAGGHIIQDLQITPDESFNLERSFLEHATDEQLDHFASSYYRGLVDQVDHLIWIEGTDFPQSLRDVDPARIMRRQAAFLPLIGWQEEKEQAGRLHWTIALWGTAAMAAEAGLTLEQYWEQIIRACHLADADPVSRWRETIAEVHRRRDWLNSLPIERLHVQALDTDLWLTIGAHRRWAGGSGRNIPSFEVFTSPDWRHTNGHIAFSEPLYSHGTLARGIRLEFQNGLVTNVTAEENPELVRQIVAAPGGNRVGEFSLTDTDISTITRFMANTLYDENIGGRFGNTHLALGMSITDTYAGDPSSLSESQWQKLGYNLKASVHNDLVSTTNRTVTAVMRDGSQRVIYAEGRFQLDT
ncbi:MAG: aminopeptidase [Solirubrobacteraceae bacterium]